MTPSPVSHRPPLSPVPPASPVRGQWARRGALLAGAAWSLAACGPTIYEDAGSAFQLLVTGAPDVPVTRDQIRQIPYATLRAKVANGQRSVLVLFRYDGADLHWMSADRIALTTRAGRLVKTAGLPSNLRASDVVGGDPVSSGLHHLAGPVRKTRLVDIEPGARYGIPIEMTLEPEAEETIEILDLTYDTIRVRERCHAPLLEWSFDNVYWVERSNGFVWRSTQYFAPEFDPVELEILKKAS
ncbi:MAG: YjbF family lipoprotein [Alphaproteobacteria bacterium]